MAKRNVFSIKINQIRINTGRAGHNQPVFLIANRSLIYRGWGRRCGGGGVKMYMERKLI
jgi:hypothetical protein